MHIHFLLVMVFLGFTLANVAAETARYKLKEAVVKVIPPFSLGYVLDFSGEAGGFNPKSRLLFVTLHDETKNRSSFQFCVPPTEHFKLMLCKKFEVTVFFDENGRRLVKIVGKNEDLILFDLCLYASFITIVPDEEPKEKPKPPPVPREQDESELVLI